MSQNNEEEARDTFRFGWYDFEIHDLTEDRNNFPNFPFAINIPFVPFTQNQLQTFMVRFFQMLRTIELENMYNYNPLTNIPYSIFCGFCNEVHIIDRPLNQAMTRHLSSGVIVTPYWIPLILRPTFEGGDNQQRQEWSSCRQIYYRQVVPGR